VVAKKILKDITLLDETPCNEINAKIIELGGVPVSDVPATQDVAVQQALDAAIKDGDSLGAIIECAVPDIDPGYGEPFWDSVESCLAHAIFAIPGVRGIEFGDGFKAAAMKGSEHNDPINENGRPTKNGAGGINGGITNGAPVLFRVAFKPTSSIRKAQQTYNFATQQMDELEVPGRHDVCFALRAPVVVEAMTAIVLADLALCR
jgi:chorismate synthase